MTLEDTLFKDIRAGKQVDIERALLTDRFNTEEGIARDKADLDELDLQFKKDRLVQKVNGEGITDDEEKARHLYGFLQTKKRQGIGGGHNNLSAVLTAQALGLPMGNGDCMGLTSLLTAIGLRNGLKLTILYNPCHVLSRLRVGEKIIDIENTRHDGFGIDLRKENSPAYTGICELPIIALVALGFSNEGTSLCNYNHWDEAIRWLEASISIYPLPGAYNNLGRAYAGMGRYAKAISNYNKSVRLAPLCAFPYYNRGIIKNCWKQYNAAIIDFDRAIELKPDFSGAYYNRRMIREKIGDMEGAKKDTVMYEKLTGKSQ